MRVNPVLLDLCRGLLVPVAGPAQRVYFGCLVFQALALILWWPKHSLEHALTVGQGPQPLLAVMAAIGVSTAYYCLRHGAEEFLVEPQDVNRVTHEEAANDPMVWSALSLGSRRDLQVIKKLSLRFENTLKFLRKICPTTST